MLVKTKKILLFLFIILFFILPFDTARARNLYYYREPKIHRQEPNSILYITPIKERSGKFIFLDLVVDPNNDEINTVSANISFPASKLSLEQVSKENTFCLFFVEEKIDNENGHAKFSCLKPYPGTDTISNVISLVFKEKESGEADIVIGDSLVLANDGYGTNVLKETRGQTIFIR